MAAVKKPTAADRTMGLFGQPPQVDEPPEYIVPEQKGERKPIEEDVDRMREAAFRGHEWASQYFASPDAPANEYRVSKKGQVYYVETVFKEPGKPAAHGYSGVFVHERDIMELTKVLVAAVRAKQAADAK